MKYYVTIIRTSHASNTVKVEANSQEEAEKIALEDAGNHLYKEKSSDYEVE